MARNFSTACARVFPWLVYVALFLLPWQTRYMFDQKWIRGVVWEYGVLSLYAVEVLVIAAFFLGQRLHVNHRFRPVIRWTGVVLLVLAAQLPFSLNPDLSFNAWTHLMIAALLFMVLLDERVQIRSAIVAYLVGLMIPAFLGFFQFFSGFSPASTLLGLAVHHATDLGAAVIETASGRYLRAYGSWSHPNVFGGYLAVGCILLGWIWYEMRPQPTVQKIGWYVMTTVLVFALILTFSRSAWLGFLCACIAYVIRERHRGIPTRQIFSPLIPLLFPLIFGVLLFSPLVFSRFQPTDRLEAQSIHERVGQYQQYPVVVRESLFFGSGLGTYTLALATLQPDQPIYAYQPIHNVFFLMIAEVGIVGCFFVICWVVYVWRFCDASAFSISLSVVLLPAFLLDHYGWSSWSGVSLLVMVMAFLLRKNDPG